MNSKEPRDQEIKIKVTTSEKLRICENARERNMKISSFCRQQALNATSSSALPQKKAKLYNQMQYMLNTYTSDPDLHNDINKLYLLTEEI